MGISQDLFGTTRTVPETGDRNWGSQVTGILLDLMRAADTGFFLLNQNGVLRLNFQTETLAASATITPARFAHLIDGSGGPVTLDGTTAIADGSVDGQVLILLGNDAANTVEVPNSANTRLNGGVTLALGDAIGLFWNATDSNWWELFRNN